MRGHMLEATSRVVGQAKRFSAEIAQGVKRSRSFLKQLAQEGLRRQLDEMRVKQVMRQTRARIFQGNTRGEGKLLSLFEPSTEVIRKGKVSKPNEFGKMDLASLLASCAFILPSQARAMASISAVCICAAPSPLSRIRCSSGPMAAKILAELDRDALDQLRCRDLVGAAGKIRHVDAELGMHAARRQPRLHKVLEHQAQGGAGLGVPDTGLVQHDVGAGEPLDVDAQRADRGRRISWLGRSH